MVPWNSLYVLRNIPSLSIVTNRKETDGPIMSQTDLYLLNPKLEVHPVLTHSLKSFQLVFNLASGQTGGYNADASDRDLPFTQKEEVATLPRVTELIIISRLSPWCTIVRNPRGVCMADVCTQLWKECVSPCTCIYRLWGSCIGSVTPNIISRTLS